MAVQLDISEAGAVQRPGNSGRNLGTGLELGWLEGAQVNRSAVERRASTLPGRRTV